jgi:acetyl-CoA acetyltransferase
VSLTARAAIIGAGATEQGEIPGESPEVIAVRAVEAALRDAGIDKRSIDGLITCKAPLTTHGTDESMGPLLGINPAYSTTLDYAVFRTPMTIEDYLAMPYIVAPLRRPDLTVISDGGAAFIVTGAERAADLHPAPVYVRGMAQQSAIRNEQNEDKLMRPWLGDIATRLYAQAGMSPADMDIAYLQDGTSVWVLQMLEAYGFCGIGEAGPVLAAGNTRPGGSLPVNTNGGQLSESYTHNWMHLYEAVRQLRGEGGERQVAGARRALLAQTHDFWKGAASILAADAA